MKKKEAKYPIPIREWSEDDRPREKLLKYGEHTPCNACPVGQNDRTGVNFFSTCLLAKSDRIGADRIDLLNRGDAIPLGVQLFFKQGSHKAPLTHKEGGAFLFYLRRVTLAMSLLKERINLWG